MFCRAKSFLDLSISRLKTLYRNLEDIWNYRLQLSNEMKCWIFTTKWIGFQYELMM